MKRLKAPGIAELTRADVPRVRALMQEYGDQPMDLTDAALVRTAEREGVRKVVTLDRHHFTVCRIGGRSRFTVVP